MASPILAATILAHGAGIRFLIASATVVASLMSDGGVSLLLNDTKPFIMRQGGAPDIGEPALWNGIHINSFKSSVDIANAISAGLDPDVKGVMYDYESWSFTPSNEQLNAAPYVQSSAALAHASNLLLLTAPGVDLTTVLAPGSPIPADQLYIQLQIPADAARYADVYFIQSQRFGAVPATFARFVREAAAQARAANPKIIIFAGVSTQPSGNTVTADQLLSCINSTRDIVDGYWVNVPAPGSSCPLCTAYLPDIAIDVIHQLR